MCPDLFSVIRNQRLAFGIMASRCFATKILHRSASSSRVGRAVHTATASNASTTTIVPPALAYDSRTYDSRDKDSSLRTEESNSEKSAPLFSSGALFNQRLLDEDPEVNTSKGTSAPTVKVRTGCSKSSSSTATVRTTDEPRIDTRDEVLFLHDLLLRQPDLFRAPEQRTEIEDVAARVLYADAEVDDSYANSENVRGLDPAHVHRKLHLSRSQRTEQQLYENVLMNAIYAQDRQLTPPIKQYKRKKNWVVTLRSLIEHRCQGKLHCFGSCENGTFSQLMIDARMMP